MNTAPRSKDDPTAAPPQDPRAGAATGDRATPSGGAPSVGTLPYASTPPDRCINDPDRIRGDALRRSLYYTFVAWIPGAAWYGATSGAPAIELARYLGANDFVFSLMSAAPLLGVLLQVPGSLLVEWLGRRKKFFLLNAIPARAVFILIGLLPWIAPRSAVHAMWPAMVMILLLFVSACLGNFGDSGWINWMAHLVPERVRGKYFGRRSRSGIGIICLSGTAAALLLDLGRQPSFTAALAPLARWSGIEPLILVISLVFVVAGIAGTCGILFFFKVDDPPMKRAPSEPIARRLVRPLADWAFVRFVAYRAVWTMAQGFCGWLWLVYLLDFFDRQTALGRQSWWSGREFLWATVLAGAASQVGSFLGYSIWGRAIDRFGCKPAMFIGSSLHSISWMFWVFLSPALLPWLFLTEMLGGFLFGGVDLATFNMMLQFNRRGGPGYQAVGTVIFSVAGALAAMISGKLAETVLKHFTWTIFAGTPYAHTFNRYAVLIAIAIVIKYIADLAFLAQVHDVAGKPAIHTLRFVVIGTYGRLNSLVLTPLRSGAGRAASTLDDVRETLTDAAAEQFRRWWR